MLALHALCEGPLRFDALRRAVPGVTQKVLTQCLRRLAQHQQSYDERVKG
ncbi:winged helix-turn-helix transcriptional regulator [Paracoccus liaowanqingii]|nr:winged helix-turn-helix transcriptional regulator [Paracoccus liaowanqingii]